jgi:hypothetical protein
MTPPHIMINVTEDNDAMKIAHLWCVSQKNVLFMYGLLELGQLLAAICRVKTLLPRQTGFDGAAAGAGSA